MSKPQAKPTKTQGSGSSKGHRTSGSHLMLCLGLGAWCLNAASMAHAENREASPKAVMTEAVQAGLYRCHQGAQILVKNIAPDLGSIVVRFKGKEHLLFAIETDTGAVRYQDKRTGMTWIKIPSKSMLLDSKLGRQLANDCKL